MKKNLVVLAALVGLSLAAPSRARAVGTPPTYVTSVRVTPGAAPTHVLAFQNTSASLDVVVRRIEVVNASTQAVTGGAEQFWVYAATSVTHSAAAGTTASYGAALASQPSYLTVSTAPTSVQLEGDSGILTTAQRNALSGALPIIAPLTVDGDESATPNMRQAAWQAEDQGGANPAGALILPAGANRAIVVEKRAGNSTDFTAGSYIIRVFYTVR
jgi:hypothetical protein